MADKNTIGWKLQTVRESRGLSVEQLADRADLKAVVIGQIESGALIPSLGPLIRIARALGVRLGTFLDDQENVGPVVVRSGEKRKVMYVSERSTRGRATLISSRWRPTRRAGTWSPS
jgi:transcriptional regulator with XRE-family HTH domain